MNEDHSERRDARNINLLQLAFFLLVVVAPGVFSWLAKGGVSCFDCGDRVAAEEIDWEGTLVLRERPDGHGVWHGQCSRCQVEHGRTAYDVIIEEPSLYGASEDSLLRWAETVREHHR